MHAAALKLERALIYLPQPGMRANARQIFTDARKLLRALLNIIMLTF